jgi:hypothetical protein
MIILITIGLICFVGYSLWISNLIFDKFYGNNFGLFVTLCAIMLPAAIIGQVLMWTGVIK